MKESSGKMTIPGRKQIFRSFANGRVKSDRLGLITESAIDEQPLLQLVMKQGEVQMSQSLAEIRERTAASVASLPDECRRLDDPVSVGVEISTELQELVERTRNEPQRRKGREGR